MHDTCAAWNMHDKCMAWNTFMIHVSTENISMYTVHEIHVFLHVSCMKAYMIRVWHKTSMKHVWYEICAAWMNA